MVGTSYSYFGKAHDDLLVHKGQGGEPAGPPPDVDSVAAAKPLSAASRIRRKSLASSDAFGFGVCHCTPPPHLDALELRRPAFGDRTLPHSFLACSLQLGAQLLDL